MASASYVLTSSLLILGILLCSLMAEARTVPREEAFVKTQGSHFVLHGAPFLFNGFNAYWMMHVAADPSQRAKVSTVFKDASASGLTVCRTWAFTDGGDRALQVAPGTYDERVFQGLDFVLSEAKKYGIRMILSFVNNYNDFGGRPQYAQWAKTAGANVSNDDDFYTHPVTRDYYKNHVRKVVTRVNTITAIAYKDDPTIMAWELINEPRCQVDYSGKTVNGWVQEMARFVKSLDRRHLLEIGMEGFYGDTMPQRKNANPGYQVGTDFISSHLVKEIDFATIHAYPDIWLSGKTEDEQMGFMERWMGTHWEDARKILKKPLVVAEFGRSSKDPGFSENDRDLYMANVYRDIYRFARAGGTMSGSLVWQLVAEDMNEFDDGYSIVLSQMPATAGIISGQSHAMNTLSHLVSGASNGGSAGGDGMDDDVVRIIRRNRARRHHRRHHHRHGKQAGSRRHASKPIP